MPVSIGIQWPKREGAIECGKGNLQLVFCPQCGFIWNRAFDPGRLEYSQAYDNSLDFSKVFQDYARSLADRLIRTYDIRNKTVLELGCGKGQFLTLLCEMGSNRGVGFDPSFDSTRIESRAAESITAIQDYYGAKYSHYRGDLICCRHVLEHIQDPLGFLRMVRHTLEDQDSTVVYFEVPNARFVLEQLSVWDVIYEHCNYFGREALANAFQHGGFEVLRLEECYDGQFISVEARPTPSASSSSRSEEGNKAIKAATQHFSQAVRERSDAWQSRLADWRGKQRRAVIWGAGAKAVSFLNMLKIAGEIPYAVDINPHKQGHYLPGTAQKIVPPEFLKEFQPQSVVLMNPIYQQEVKAQLKSLGVDAEVIPA